MKEEQGKLAARQKAFEEKLKQTEVEKLEMEEKLRLEEEQKAKELQEQQVWQEETFCLVRIGTFKRNIQIHASRNMCGWIFLRLKALEAKMEALKKQHEEQLERAHREATSKLDELEKVLRTKEDREAEIQREKEEMKTESEKLKVSSKDSDQNVQHKSFFLGRAAESARMTLPAAMVIYALVGTCRQTDLWNMYCSPVYQ